MENNYVHIQKGFRILLEVMAPYMAREFHNSFGEEWWNIAVMDILYEDQKRDLPETGEWSTLVDSLDIQQCLRLFDLNWNTVFRKKLSIDNRTWSKELMGVRNRLAHLGGDDFSNDDTWRALDTMSRLSDQIDPESAEEIRAMLRTLRYGSAAGSTTVMQNAPNSTPTKSKKIGILETTPTRELPSWRDVIEPHPDVSQGRYKNAEFAADLAQVARGEGALEYIDPVEFFARTFVTEGITGLLEQALRRVAGMDGEPVIQLKTAFGGGKTHSLLALYHMMRGRVAIEKIPNIKPVLERAGVAALPRANIAVLVGTAIDPTKSKRPNNMPGVTINTLWGEMAAQLAESSGKPELYDFVKEADKKGVSPGSEALKNLFNAAAPSVVLMDEVVSYAKKLYGVNGLPAGSFDNFISFIQEVTEAARASENSLVVASIPESEIEIGGDAGKIALDTIEHTFGRMESIWKPVTANEGFEVVRRRLFLDCKDSEGRDAVCSKFSRMYADNPGDFPLESKEVEYRERMLSCYPIHPEVFDRLYNDWATLERFQRTRGVLRLMAAVIHELWMGNDAGLMIMPGSIPLDVPNVRDELTRHLSEGWNAVVDREVDGKNSVPYQLDQSIPRYGNVLAARRVTRTILLGSAPTVRDQTVRGIEASRIRLGVVQPGENIANFNDALGTLTNSLAYLYTNPSGDRFWYDTRPTLRKTVEDRATQIVPSDVEFEIENRLRMLRREQPFAGIHLCPGSSLDVPDEQATRLVVLRPAEEYKPNKMKSTAMTAVTDILNNRGNAPRIYRNMLAFVAPDQDLMLSLKEAVRLFLAWKSIKDDSEDLNLDAAQNRETDNNLRRSDQTVDARVKETYCWLLAPYIDRVVELKVIDWNVIRISGGNDNIVTKAAKKMIQNEAVIDKWSPLLLKMQLDELLWREADHIEIKKLWEDLCTYLYLPRLSDLKTLEETIQKGLESSEYFGYAEGIEGDRYVGLKFNQSLQGVERSALLVKQEIAQKQIEEDARKRAEFSSDSGTSDGDGGFPSQNPVFGGEDQGHDDLQKPSLKSRFFMSADLDNTRIGRDVQRLVDEVIRHITCNEDGKVEIILQVEAECPKGYSPETVRTVTENCSTLRVRDFGFVE